VIAALSIAAFAAGIGTIAADGKGNWRLVYVLKPAAMAAIILIALVRSPVFPPRYQTFIVAGLSASLLGDIFMMLRKKRFTEGLACFLVAHGLYIAAFLATMRPRVELPTALPLIFYAMIMMRVLFPHAGRIKAPLAVYIMAITIMAALGMDRFIRMGGTPAFEAFAGAVLFMVSDSILAVNRFVRKVPAAQPLILGTYFLAQWLFAMSV
jgi:uncharacterized membrane protein YhhN